MLSACLFYDWIVGDDNRLTLAVDQIKSIVPRPPQKSGPNTTNFSGVNEKLANVRFIISTCSKLKSSFKSNFEIRVQMTSCKKRLDHLPPL